MLLDQDWRLTPACWVLFTVVWKHVLFPPLYFRLKDVPHRITSEEAQMTHLGHLGGEDELNRLDEADIHKDWQHMKPSHKKASLIEIGLLYRIQ